MSKKTKQGFPEWVSCPECNEEKNVHVYTTYDREIGFECLECGHKKDPTYGVWVN